jgi:hypothetical protein
MMIMKIIQVKLIKHVDQMLFCSNFQLLAKTTLTFLCGTFYLVFTLAYTHTCTRTHTRAHEHTHTHTHTPRTRTHTPHTRSDLSLWYILFGIVFTFTVICYERD